MLPIRFLCVVSFLSSTLSALPLAQFPFSVGPHALYQPAGAFYLGATEPFMNNDKAVVMIGRNAPATQIRGITPPFVLINRSGLQPNPLFGQAIQHLALLAHRPVVIPANLPASLFLINERAEPIEVSQSAVLCDAQGMKAPSIRQLTTTAPSGTLQELQADAALSALAVVPNQEGTFDGTGSGIALAAYRQVEDISGNARFFAWDIADANTGQSSFTDRGHPTLGDPAFAPRPTKNELPEDCEALLASDTWHDSYLTTLKEQLIAKNPAHTKAEDEPEKPVKRTSVQARSRKRVPPGVYAMVRVLEHYSTAQQWHLFKQMQQRVKEHPLTVLPQGQGNRARAFDSTTPELSLGSQIARLIDVPALHFNRDLGKLYIGATIQTAQAVNAGGRAVVAASIANNIVSYTALAPDGAFDEQDRIVGQRAQGTQLGVTQLATMQTRTNLRYLIVAREQQGQPQVFALPVVDTIVQAVHEDPSKPIQLDMGANGTLADVTAMPVVLYSAAEPHRFLSRRFVTPATTPQQLYTAQSIQARIGGTAQLPGPITELRVASEAVFASCGPPFEQADVQAGLFFSQPVFDQFGRISRWTEWQRAATPSTALQGFAFDEVVGQYWDLPLKDNNTTVGRSSWELGGDQLAQFVSNSLTPAVGGVQGLQDFPYTTPQFSQTPGQRLAVQCFTSYKRCLLVQTGRDVAGRFGPVERIATEDLYSSDDGTLKGFQPAPALALGGGVLDQIGPISSCAVVSDGTYGWFVVGGTNGVAVLADEQGRGFTNLSSRFTGLTPTMAWRHVADVKHIWKLHAQDGQLFILGQEVLSRVVLSADTIAQGAVMPVVLSQLTDEEQKRGVTYADLYLKGPLAVLATSTGLRRSASGQDSRIAAPLDWVEVPLPESVGSLSEPGPVTRLYGIQTAGADTLYVLNGAVSLNQSMVYRFVVQLQQGIVNDQSVLKLPDMLLQGVPSFFVNPGNYRNYVATDGSLIALSRSAVANQGAFVELLPPEYQVGLPPGRRRVSLVDLDDAQTVGGLVRSSASGSWMVPGSFGVRIQK